MTQHVGEKKKKLEGRELSSSVTTNGPAGVEPNGLVVFFFFEVCLNLELGGGGGPESFTKGRRKELT